MCDWLTGLVGVRVASCVNNAVPHGPNTVTIPVALSQLFAIFLIVLRKVEPAPQHPSHFHIFSQHTHAA